MGERTKLFGDRGEQMKRGSIVQARTDVQHFHYLGVMHKGDGEKTGSFSWKNNSRKKSTRPRTFISQFYQHETGLLRVPSKEEKQEKRSTRNFSTVASNQSEQ